MRSCSTSARGFLAGTIRLRIPRTTCVNGELRLSASWVSVTDTGRAVLAGHLDRIAVCGIDRWLGGVHLHSGGVLWRWDLHTNA